MSSVNKIIERLVYHFHLGAPHLVSNRKCEKVQQKQM